MFIPDIKLIDKALVDAIENIFYITNSNEIYLERLIPILKLEFTKNDFNDLLNPFEIPKYFQVLENFISTPSGKISRTLTQQKTRNNAWRKIL